MKTFLQFITAICFFIFIAAPMLIWFGIGILKIIGLMLTSGMLIIFSNLYIKEMEK
jgi:hypothetical protein